MKKVFIFIFCCLFSLSAQAGVSDCVTALKNAMSTDNVNQEMADKLSQAIVEGDTKTIKKLAKPWRNLEGNTYSFNSYYDNGDDIHIQSDDLLLFAAYYAAYHQTPTAIESLKTIVKKGFNISTKTEIHVKILYGKYVLPELFGPKFIVSETSKQILNILVKAGLTAKNLLYTPHNSLTATKSPVHEVLKSVNYDGLKAAFNSGLFTTSDVNTKFDTNITDDPKGHEHDMLLLYWYAKSTQYIEHLKILLEKGAMVNMGVGPAGSGATILRAASASKNYPGLIALLKHIKSFNWFSFDINHPELIRYLELNPEASEIFHSKLVRHQY